MSAPAPLTFYGDAMSPTFSPSLEPVRTAPRFRTRNTSDPELRPRKALIELVCSSTEDPRERLKLIKLLQPIRPSL